MAAEIRESLTFIFFTTVIGLVLGLVLERYLLKKQSKYSFLVPVFFLLYPVGRTVQLLLYGSSLAYTVLEVIYLFMPFTVVVLYYYTEKRRLNGRKRNGEMEKLKIQDL